jgi:hypothetical protein
MDGEDKFDVLLSKAEGKQSDRHDEAFDLVWNDLEKGFFESFGRAKRQAQERARRIPGAMERMTERREAAAAPSVRTISEDTEAPADPGVVQNTTTQYVPADIVPDNTEPATPVEEVVSAPPGSKLGKPDDINTKVNQSLADSKAKTKRITAAKKQKRRIEELEAKVAALSKPEKEKTTLERLYDKQNVPEEERIRPKDDEEEDFDFEDEGYTPPKDEDLVSEVPSATNTEVAEVIPETEPEEEEEEENPTKVVRWSGSPSKKEKEEETEQTVEDKAALAGFDQMMANDDLDFAESETNPDVGETNRRIQEEIIEETKPPNSDNLLDVIPISSKVDNDKLLDLLGLVPVGDKKETTEDIAEETMQVEMPSRMYQVADDGTIIGSKITKKKAEKLIGGEATFDGKVLQLNRPPTDKEKKMASSRWDSEKGQSVPIEVVDDLVEDEKVEPPKEEPTPGDLDNPDLGPEDGETMGSMMEMPDILDKPKDEPDKPEDFPMIFASNADKYWPMYMEEAEGGNLAAAKHLKNMLDEDLADAIGENYDDMLDELNDLIASNEEYEKLPGIQSERDALGEEGYAKQHTYGDDRDPNLRRYTKPDEFGTHYDFDELESEPPTLSPEELISAISYARNLTIGSGKKREAPNTYVYWNKDGEAVGMRAVDRYSGRMLNVGATQLPNMSKPMNDYDSMFSESETDKDDPNFVSLENRQQFKDDSKQMFADQQYRVTQVDPDKIAEAVKAIGPIGASSGKSKFRTFEGRTFSDIDDVPGLDETDKHGNQLKRGIYESSLARALKRKYPDKPQKITTPSMLPDPTATNEAGELLHPFNPEGHTGVDGMKLPQYDFSTMTGEGMSGLPRKKVPGLPYSIINAMKEKGFRPTGRSARPSDSETRIMFGQGQGTPKSGKLVPSMKGQFAFDDLDPERHALPERQMSHQVGRRMPIVDPNATLHETTPKDFKTLLAGSTGERMIGNQAFGADLLAALGHWPTKDMAVRYPGEGMPEGVGPMSVSSQMREGIPMSMHIAPRTLNEGDLPRRMLKSENPNDNYSLLPSSFFDQGPQEQMAVQDNMSLLPAGWGDEQ